METSDSSIYQDFEWAVRLNRFSLELTGLWPKPEQTARERLACELRALFVFLTITFVIIIPSFHSLIRIHGNIMPMIDNLQYTLPLITCMLRLVIFCWKREALTPLVVMMADDWKKPKSHQDAKAMITRAHIARIIITVGYSLMMTGLAVMVIMPVFGTSVRYLTNITDPGRPLPLQTYYIYDATKSPQYELTFVSQTVSIFFCSMLYTGVDNFLSLMVFHISGQLDILARRLMDLDKYMNFTNALNSCVIDHVRLLRAIAGIEDIFNVLLLMLFLYFGALFAFYGFLVISLIEDGGYPLLSGIAYLVTVVTNAFGHMCVYCAVGEMLAAQCDRIHYAAYCNKWYNLDGRRTRDNVLLMLQTSKPLYLTAGKLFPLTMATFCNLIKTSAGYISILLATRS